MHNKEFTTLQAKAALHGYQMRQTATGAVAVVRGIDFNCVFASTAEAARWLSLAIGEVTA